MAYADHTIVIGSILDISLDDGLGPLVIFGRMLDLPLGFGSAVTVRVQVSLRRRDGGDDLLEH
jgi:hypothetical protein